MKDILAPGGREVLAALAATRLVLAFDYDGTLAPLVPDPACAHLRPSTRRLLAGLMERYPCAVISGRARADVLRLLDGLDLRFVVGNHGTEWGPLDPGLTATAEIVCGWRDLLTERLGACGALGSAVWIEDKGLSLSLHLRAPPGPERERLLQDIDAAVAALECVRRVGGKDIINLVPAGAPHKGQALLQLRARSGCDHALYVGDDQTDEDVFALGEPGWLLTVRVGACPASRAAYCIRAQEEIDELLAALLRLRT